jgi:endonuclease/exonuclease/phosphatase family metal-dependent hydrolase
LAQTTFFSILTFNVGQCRFRYFKKKPWVEPAGFLEERFALLPDALLQTNADIICVQELFNYDYRQDLRHVLADKLHRGYRHRACDGPPGKRFSPNQGPGLGIFSKRSLHTHAFIPFDVSNFVEWIFVRKGFQVATFDLPGVGTVRLINVHTASGKDPESAYNEGIRHLQQEQILELLERDPYDVDLLTGDFNHDVDVSHVNYEQIIEAGFTDAFLSAGGTGDSWSVENPFNRFGPHGHCPSQRVDHVFIRERKTSRLRPVRAKIVLDESCVRVEHDGRATLSDHYGVQVWFEY